MSAWKDASTLTTILQPAVIEPTADKRLMIAHLNTNEEDLLQMRPLVSNLTALTKQYEKDSEPWAAAHVILTFVHNARLLSGRKASFIQQASVLSTIRTWVPWLPRAPEGMQTRDLPVMTIMAYYHAAAIASEAYLPDVTQAIFLPKRCEVVANIWNELLRLEGCLTNSPDDLRATSEAIQMTVVPVVYAVRYKVKHATSGEMIS
jgi:hypothetical protein